MNALLERTDVTPEELLTIPDGNSYELIDGKLVEPPMSMLADLVAGTIQEAMGQYARAHQLGYVFPGTAQYQCFPSAPNRIRKPDVTFIRRGRLTLAQMQRGFCRIAPDLAVEVVSPNDLFDEVDVKVEEFLNVGTRLLWVVCLKTRQVQIHRADGSMSKVRADQELDGEDLLPGFRCRVDTLFPRPEEANPVNESEPTR